MKFLKMSWGSCHCNLLLAAKNQCGQWPLWSYLFVSGRTPLVHLCFEAFLSGATNVLRFFVGDQQCFETFGQGPPPMFWGFLVGRHQSERFPPRLTSSHLSSQLRWEVRYWCKSRHTHRAQADLKKLGSFPGLLQKSRRSEIHLLD